MGQSQKVGRVDEASEEILSNPTQQRWFSVNEEEEASKEEDEKVKSF